MLLELFLELSSEALEILMKVVRKIITFCSQQVIFVVLLLAFCVCCVFNCLQDSKDDKNCLKIDMGWCKCCLEYLLICFDLVIEAVCVIIGIDCNQLLRQFVLLLELIVISY
eukprot:TRINITY_DN28155_c0_g1_i1.p5 TRINITY_DN28155_c0_g1~~TRINITY_DN28155_c0_g1_i1.p5  ORF type:complete len:112 (+),score=7.57 TRINITY_DN28155_c0_g1_i1:514-849(+)